MKVLETRIKSAIFLTSNWNAVSNPGHWLLLANDYKSAGWNNPRVGVPVNFVAGHFSAFADNCGHASLTLENLIM
jgi:hypothetical protein